jgi:hypothetical protein
MKMVLELTAGSQRCFRIRLDRKSRDDLDGHGHGDFLAAKPFARRSSKGKDFNVRL